MISASRTSASRTRGARPVALLLALAAVAACVAPAAPAVAQEAAGREPAAPSLPELETGARLEVWSPLLVDRRERGTLRAPVDAELRFSPARPDTVYRIPVESLRRVRVRAGRRPAPLRGAFLGTAAGLAAAIAWDEATGERDEAGLIVQPRWGARAAIVAGGAAAGALVGQLLRVDDWREVELDP